MTTHPASSSRDLAIEGLRGLAAFTVFFHHTMLESVGGWSPPRWLPWMVEAPAAVMIFFVLSGYVIGLTNNQIPARGSLRGYAWRRFIRLVPINAMAVLLALAVATDWDFELAITHLLFLQSFNDYAGVWVPVIPTNGNLWSLNHEVVFYILFAVIWVARLPLAQVAAAAGALLLLGWYTPFAPVFAACYAAGFLFWLSGLALAWHAPRTENVRDAWPSALLLALITWKLQLLLHSVSMFPMPKFGGPTVKLYYLDFLPVSVWLLATVARRTFPLLPWVRRAAFAIPAFGLAVHLLGRPGNLPAAELAAIAAIYAVALALAGWRPSLRVFQRVAAFGAISFAFYAFARPVELFVFRHPALPQNAGGFALAAGLTFAVTAALAWFFERRCQPALRRLGLARPAETPPALAERSPSTS